MEERLEGYPGQTVFCPRCGKKHYCPTGVMDEHIKCGCGLHFYAFANKGLRIIMPTDEAGYEPIARALRRFVVSTGRCTDIPPELYQDPDGQYCFGFFKRGEDIEQDPVVVTDGYGMILINYYIGFR